MISALRPSDQAGILLTSQQCLGYLHFIFFLVFTYPIGSFFLGFRTPPFAITLHLFDSLLGRSASHPCPSAHFPPLLFSISGSTFSLRTHDISAYTPPLWISIINIYIMLSFTVEPRFISGAAVIQPHYHSVLAHISAASTEGVSLSFFLRTLLVSRHLN